jgi:hypothetical protein
MKTIPEARKHTQAALSSNGTRGGSSTYPGLLVLASFQLLLGEKIFSQRDVSSLMKSKKHLHRSGVVVFRARRRLLDAFETELDNE